MILAADIHIRRMKRGQRAQGSILSPAQAATPAGIYTLNEVGTKQIPGETFHRSRLLVSNNLG